jgi:uroporphyrinogen decarboxylase
MTSRERVLRALNHQIPDRVPIHDAPWISTIQRWYKEGLPEDTTPEEHFGFEFEFFGADTSPRLPVKVLEKNEEYIITTTSQGGKRRNHRDYSTTPEIIDWPIKTKDDWKEIKKLLKPDFTRVDWSSGLARNKTAYEDGKFLCYSGGYGYDILQSYMASEQMLVMMAEDPEWMKEMVMTLAESTIIMAELMLNNGFKFDAAFMYNDMGYKNGLLFSPETYKKTHYEADRLVYAYFHSKGLKTILHSCGNVSELIPIMIETGLDCLQPLEVKAGMDVRKLKAKHGDSISFMGGIDVRLMADEDPSKIEEEIKTKIEAAKENGGYIYHSDHSIPKNVSFQQYCRVMELVKQYGAYPEYEEAQKEQPQTPEKPPVVPSQAEVKKRRGLFGKKKAKAEPPAPEQAVAQQSVPEEKKQGRRFFGKKGEESKKEEVKPAAPQPAPQKTEQPAGDTEKKKGFKMPFGKKK